MTQGEAWVCVTFSRGAPEMPRRWGQPSDVANYILWDGPYAVTEDIIMWSLGKDFGGVYGIIPPEGADQV